MYVHVCVSVIPSLVAVVLLTLHGRVLALGLGTWTEHSAMSETLQDLMATYSSLADATVVCVCVLLKSQGFIMHKQL